jgi:hypothetical protein
MENVHNPSDSIKNSVLSVSSAHHCFKHGNSHYKDIPQDKKITDDKHSTAFLYTWKYQFNSSWNSVFF